MDSTISVTFSQAGYGSKGLTLELWEFDPALDCVFLQDGVSCDGSEPFLGIDPEGRFRPRFWGPLEGGGETLTLAPVQSDYRLQPDKGYLAHVWNDDDSIKFFWTFYTQTQAAVAAPTFDPAQGTFTAPPLVTIASTTAGASIRYTVDGTTPTATTGTPYVQPILADGVTIKAVAYNAGMLDSPVAQASYTTVAASPTAFTQGEMPGTWDSVLFLPGGVTEYPTLLTFVADGTGTIRYPPSEDNENNPNNVSPIAWSIVEQKLVFIETSDDEDQWTWTYTRQDGASVTATSHSHETNSAEMEPGATYSFPSGTLTKR